MSDWSDEPEQSWAEQQRAKKKALAAKKKKEPESDWSDEAPVKAKKSVKKPVKDSFSDEEPPKPVKSKKPTPKEDVWSDEEPVKPKKSSKPKKEEIWSDEEPVKKSVKSKKSAPKPVEEDWSDDEKPVKPKKVEKPKKKPAEDPWSDEEPVKPKKKVEPVKPKKKVQEEPWSDEEEEVKPKKIEKPKSKKPVVDEEAWSDEEPKPKKSSKKTTKADSFSDEEPVKTKKPAPVEDPWSDEDEAPKKPAKSKKAPLKKQDDGFSSDEEKPAKPSKPSPKPIKKAAPVKKDGDSDSDAWGSEKEDSKPKKFTKKAKNNSDSDNDSDDGGFGGSDKGSEAERTPVTYVPDYDAAEDDNLYNETCKKGLDFDNYEKINVNCTGYDEKDQFKGIKKWTDLDDLNDDLYETIKKKMGWQKPTPIQKFSLPLMMQGRDIMGCAQTGSGKTGGFSIPVVNKILTENLMNDKNSEDGSDDGSDDGRRKPCCTPIALVCAPTRELVQQIQRDFVKLTKDTEIKVEYVVGGHAVRSQLDKIEGSHIIVATPGRLNDFVGKGKIVLDKLKFLIVDEADRMLEMGFMEILKDLAAKMPEKEERTTAMFSATFPDEVQKIAHDFLKENYVFVVVGIVGAAANSVEQRFIKIDGDVNKEDSLIDLLEGVKETGEKTVIFVETKRMADFWATKLSTLGFPSTSIHGDREQKEREEALRTFRSGEHPILVATNVAARGIDIPEVMHVINHDLPKDIDEYVHRIGRTGRCGNKGRATSFYKSQYDKEKAEKICKILGMSGTTVPDWLKEDCEDADGVQPVGAGGEVSDDDSEGW